MSINQTDIERFHADGLVTLSPGFPRALLNAANEAIDGINDADFFPEEREDAFGWYKGDVLQPELLRLVCDPFLKTFPGQSYVLRPSNLRWYPCA